MDVRNAVYQPGRTDPAFSLRFSWFGWPSKKSFEFQPVELISNTAPLWEQDGLRVLESYWDADCVKILFSTLPCVAPVLLAARAKGRLDHAIRKIGLQMPFSRKVAVCSVGANHRADVETYIERQVEREKFVDPIFETKMRAFTIVVPEADLSKPVVRAHGRYWYGLHLVLVVERRTRITDGSFLEVLRDRCFEIARAKDYFLSRVSLMPDHVHLSMRGNPDESPETIALSFQNELSNCVQSLAAQSDSPPRQAGWGLFYTALEKPDELQKWQDERSKYRPEALAGLIRSGSIWPVSAVLGEKHCCAFGPHPARPDGEEDWPAKVNEAQLSSVEHTMLGTDKGVPRPKIVYVTSPTNSLCTSPKVNSLHFSVPRI